MKKSKNSLRNKNSYERNLEEKNSRNGKSLCAKFKENFEGWKFKESLPKLKDLLGIFLLLESPDIVHASHPRCPAMLRKVEDPFKSEMDKFENLKIRIVHSLGTVCFKKW